MSDEGLQRVSRRLARERAARREAEAIAERVTRELYDRQQELVLLEAVAAAANRSDSLEDALEQVLELVCRHLGWSLGDAWRCLHEGRLVPIEGVAFSDGDARFEAFTNATAHRTFSAGEGLPGRVLGTGQPAWIPDVTVDANFPRAALARSAGLHVGAAYPVVAEGATVAVVECFGTTVQHATPGRLKVLAQVGEQLGRVVERVRRAELRHEATHDSLTGLPNRTLFSDRIDLALSMSRRDGTLLAVALIDLDRFKEVNDTLGHPQGDRLLVEVARRLSEPLRDSDTLARLGGDEFGLVLPGIRGERDAIAVAERLGLALRDAIALDDALVDVDASIGIALHPFHGDDGETLVRHADVAMYEAKRRRQGHSVYTPANDPYSRAHLGMVAELRAALEHGELGLHYQPRVRLNDPEAVTGVEALVQWTHRERGPIDPREFMPLAERTGLIRPITAYMLRTALRQTRDWLNEGLHVPVAVNISARMVLDDAFLVEVSTALAETGVPPGLLELELSESAMVEDPSRCATLLGELSKMGIVIVIEHFGAGYASMAHLKRLPVRDLKIDPAFVGAMLDDDRNEFIVRSTIKLARELGLGVVAEGVGETDELARLRELGCDSALGGCIQRPLAGEELTAWLRDRLLRDRRVSERSEAQVHGLSTLPRTADS